MTKTTSSPFILSPDGTILLEAHTDLTTISIPKGVTTLREGAFSFCFSLKSITLPSSLTTIEDGVFMHTKIQTLMLPKSVQHIRAYAFSEMPYLKSIQVDSQNPFFTSNDGVLYTKDMTSLIVYPLGKLDDIFEMPNKVKHLQEGAFSYNHHLFEMHVGENIQTIGETNLSNCAALFELTIHPKNPYLSMKDGVLFNSTQTKLIAGIPNKVKKTYTIPSTVQSINSYAFMNCHHVETLVLTKKIKGLSENTYKYSGLKKIQQNGKAIPLKETTPYKDTPWEKIKRKHLNRAFTLITQEKYLDYFGSSKTFSEKDTLFNTFLDDMVTVSELMIRKPTALEIIEPLLEKHEKKKITLVEKFKLLCNDSSKKISILEIYALLWYASCRNTILYQESIYRKMCENKIISFLLYKFKNRDL